MRTKLSIDLQYPLMTNDTLLIELPDDISFSSNVTCEPLLLAQKVSCSNSDREIQIKFLEVTESPGFLVFYIDGIKNPSSFRPSLPLNRIYTIDAKGYKS
jgi:hypothetical protein